MSTCHGGAHNHTEHSKSGENKHSGHHAGDFLNKFWLSLILTIPVVLYSDVFKTISNITMPTLKVGGLGLEIVIPAVLGSVVFFYGGWVFLKGAYHELKARLPGMMTLIGIAITAAYLWSIYAVFAGEMPLFWELTTLITIMLLGHWVEMRAVSGAQGALKELSKLLPDTAELLVANHKSQAPNHKQTPNSNIETKTVNILELKEGDIIFVRSGGKIPADGKIIEGESDLNESMITGESKSVRKKVGDEVIAGTINGDGVLTVEVTHIGENTFLAGVMRLVAEAQSSKSRLQILSDRAALYLTVVAVVGGVITLVAWLVAGASVGFAVARVVAVLVIACPHALGLAVPLVASISTTKAAKNGFLIKQRLSLEAARNIDVVLFDKTGTLTEGKPKVVSVSSDEALALAAAVNVYSEHPIARAVLDETKKRGLNVEKSENYRRLPGVGVEAVINQEKVFVGHRGGDDIVVERAGRLIGTIKVQDTVRPEALTAVNTLKTMGLKVAMLTGDSEEIAKEVSDELGIDEYFARVRPEEKVEKVKLLQSQGLRVAMVGDGINDAPALTQADLGVAVGAGTNVAIESAGIILIKSDPRDIAKIIQLSKMTYSKMIQNLFWASGYNILAMPLAAGALAFKGVILEPAVAAVLMSVSTVVVAVNASLLTFKKLGNE